jgi:Seven in absentia protein family
MSESIASEESTQDSSGIDLVTYNRRNLFFLFLDELILYEIRIRSNISYDLSSTDYEFYTNQSSSTEFGPFTNMMGFSSQSTIDSDTSQTLSINLNIGGEHAYFNLISTTSDTNSTSFSLDTTSGISSYEPSSSTISSYEPSSSTISSYEPSSPSISSCKIPASTVSSYLTDANDNFTEQDGIRSDSTNLISSFSSDKDQVNLATSYNINHSDSDSISNNNPAVSNSKKRLKCTEGYFDAYICPICYNYLSIPVYKCKNDHSYCLTCLETKLGVSKCYICNNYVKSRNYFIENQLQNIMSSCIWEKEGCRETFQLSLIKLHEKNCKFQSRQIKCLFNYNESKFNCSWMGSENGLVNHLVDIHDADLYEGEDIVSIKYIFSLSNSMEIDMDLIKITRPIGGLKNPVFVLKHIYDPNSETLVFSLLSINKNIKINYYIDFIDKSKKLKFKGVTSDINYTCLENYPELDFTKVFAVPLKRLNQLSNKETYPMELKVYWDSSKY